MATLAQLRARLNAELGISDDASTTPWPQATRNQAIADGYAELWRVGVRKWVREDLPTTTSQTYALSTVRVSERLELLDASGYVVEQPVGTVRQNGLGGYELYLRSPLTTGFTLRVWGWTAYKSTFSGDADTDDLPAEYVRVPLIKARSICYRTQLGTFVRYGELHAVPPPLNATVDQLLAIIAATEREFLAEVEMIKDQQRREARPASV
jgi:hypothetical protein